MNTYIPVLDYEFERIRVFVHSVCVHACVRAFLILIIMARNGSCLTWLATSLEEKRRWLILMLPHEDNVLNKFLILKERHIQMRENRSSHLVG